MPVDEEDLDRMYETLFGNGKIGLDEMVRANTRVLEDHGQRLSRLDEKLDNVKTAVATGLRGVSDDIAALAQERRDDRQKVEGRKELFNWIKFGLALLAVGIPVIRGVHQMQSQNQMVIEQLRNLPPLPE